MTNCKTQEHRKYRFSRVKDDESFANFTFSSDKVNSVINKEDLYKLVKNLLENATKKVLYG